MINDLRVVTTPSANIKEWIDFSSMKEYLKCPRSYWWRYVQDVTTFGVKPALVTGEACHESKATFLKCQQEGLNFESCLEAGIEALKPIMAKIQHVEDDIRNLSCVRYVMERYFYQWKDSPDEVLMIEVVGAIEMGEIAFVFKVDAVKRRLVGIMIEETKTTTVIGKRWNLRGKPNLQIDGYYSGIHILTGLPLSGGVLDVIPLYNPYTAKDKAKKDEYCKPFRIETARNHEDIEVWVKNMNTFIQKIHDDKERNFFPMNTEMCHPLMGGMSCDYSTLCALYPNPHDKEIILPGDYVIERWNPLDVLEGKETEGQ